MFEKSNLINPLDTFNVNWMNSKIAIDSFIHPSFFVNHSLTVKNTVTQLHFTKYEYGAAGLLFIAFALFVWLYVSNSKFMNQLFKSFYSTRFASQFTREENSIVNRATILLSIMFLLLATLFIVKISEFYNFVEPQNSSFLFMVGAILLVSYTVKLISIRFFGFVFKNLTEAYDYISTIVLFWNALALFLLPILCCLLFLKQIDAKVFITIGLIGIGVFLLIRFVKAIVIGLNSARISKLYLFLYLCTLEILPFVILYKLFLLNIG